MPLQNSPEGSYLLIRCERCERTRRIDAERFLRESGWTPPTGWTHGVRYDAQHLYFWCPDHRLLAVNERGKAALSEVRTGVRRRAAA